MTAKLNVLAFGAGTDSTAMAIGMHERGIRIDLILFADAGGENPRTYKHIVAFSAWCVANGLPPVTIVKKVRANGEVLTLEQNCLEQKMLPSIAYGFKSCSLKYKVQPQDKFCNNWAPAIEHWKAGGKVTKFIGYDASEERRAKITEDDKYDYAYPLIDWGWEREDCIAAIKRAGLELPGKSACFFCPSSKKQEILALPVQLQARAIAMENNAELTHVKGLGRDFAWRDLLAFDAAQIKLFPESAIDIACGCFDGEPA